jgi:hypothetical protein
VHGLCQTYHRLRNRFGHPKVHLGDEAQLEAHFGLFVDSANLDARLVHVCSKSTIGSEIILDAPDGNPR